MRWKQYWQSTNGQRSLRAIGFFVAFYCGLLVFTALSQERLVYQPSSQDFNDCPAVTGFGLSPQHFNGTRFYAPASVSSSSKVVLVYHGNAGSACHRAYYLPYIEAIGAAAVLVEYAGYSNDARPPTHERIKQDISNMVSWTQRTGVTDITIIGESIGSGPAILHAGLSAPTNLILVTPFTSLKELAKHHFWYFPTDWLVHNAYDNYRDLRNYNGPRVFIHGTEDEIIPFFMSERLVTLAPSKTTLMGIENAKHNNLLAQPAFEQALTEALRIRLE